MSLIRLAPHFELLGKKVKDRVTGFSGVVTSVCFDLYGCIQAAVSPGMKPDMSGLLEAMWFDVNRLEVTDPVAVMPPPSFDWTGPAIANGEKGSAEKPAPSY